MNVHVRVAVLYSLQPQVLHVLARCCAPHGGGYIYRLCPANETISEACFNRLPLEFAFPDKHTLRFKDPRNDREVNATLVTEGGGKGWMIYPWPSGDDTGDLMYSTTGYVSLATALQNRSTADPVAARW